MTRPRLSRAAMAALHARALAENAELKRTEIGARVKEIGALARLALEIHNSRSPDGHPRLGELMQRREALERSRRP